MTFSFHFLELRRAIRSLSFGISVAKDTTTSCSLTKKSRTEKKEGKKSEFGTKFSLLPQYYYYSKNHHHHHHHFPLTTYYYYYLSLFSVTA